MPGTKGGTKGRGAAANGDADAPAHMSSIAREVVSNLSDTAFVAQRCSEAQARSAELSRENRDLRRQLEAAHEDQEDATAYAQREMERSAAALASAEATCEQLRAELSAERQRRTEQVASEAAQARAREAALRRETAEMRVKLAELHKFSESQAAFAARIAELEAALSQATERHQREIAEIEVGRVQEKERLKRDMLVKMKETKTSLLRLTENQLDTTTKRTVLENEQMATELHHQSREVEKLLQRLSAVEKRNADLLRERDLAGAESLGHAKKAQLYRKLAHALHDRQRPAPSVGSRRGSIAPPLAADTAPHSPSSPLSAADEAPEPAKRRVRELLLRTGLLQQRLDAAQALEWETVAALDVFLRDSALQLAPVHKDALAAVREALANGAQQRAGLAPHASGARVARIAPQRPRAAAAKPQSPRHVSFAAR